MNTPSSMSTALPARPGSDPVFGSFGGLFRTTLRSLEMQWFLYRGRRGKTRTIQSVGEMNAHMLRDIGAPDEMIASAAGVKPDYERQRIPFGFAMALVLLAFTVTGTSTSAETMAQSAVASSRHAQVQPASEPMAAVFAGEYVNGAPVYRFPAVLVTGSAKDDATARLQPPCRQVLARGAKSRA